MHVLLKCGANDASVESVHGIKAADDGQDAVFDLLQKGKRAGCQQADPTGLEALALAKEIRGMLRTLDRRGIVPLKLREDIAALDARDDLETAAAFHPLRLSMARG